MSSTSILWQPGFTYTPAILKYLMEIDAATAVVGHTPLPSAAENSLRTAARIRATHYSTSIEGNRLTLAEAQAVISGEQVRGKDRDVSEVRNYWNALLWVEGQAAQGALFGEPDPQSPCYADQGLKTKANLLPGRAKCHPGQRQRGYRLSSTRSRGCSASDGRHDGLAGVLPADDRRGVHGGKRRGLKACCAR